MNVEDVQSGVFSSIVENDCQKGLQKYLIAKGPKEQEAENAPFITALNMYFKIMLSMCISK